MSVLENRRIIEFIGSCKVGVLHLNQWGNEIAMTRTSYDCRLRFFGCLQEHGWIKQKDTHHERLYMGGLHFLFVKGDTEGSRL